MTDTCEKKLSDLRTKVGEANAELKQIIDNELGDEAVGRYLKQCIDKHFPPAPVQAPQTKEAKLAAIMRMNISDEDKIKLLAAL